MVDKGDLQPLSIYHKKGEERATRVTTHVMPVYGFHFFFFYLAPVNG